jgi:hypothetical protein
MSPERLYGRHDHFNSVMVKNPRIMEYNKIRKCVKLPQIQILSAQPINLRFSSRKNSRMLKARPIVGCIHRLVTTCTRRHRLCHAAFFAARNPGNDYLDPGSVGERR